MIHQPIKNFVIEPIHVADTIIKLALYVSINYYFDRILWLWLEITCESQYVGTTQNSYHMLDELNVGVSTKLTQASSRAFLRRDFFGFSQASKNSAKKVRLNLSFSAWADSIFWIFFSLLLAALTRNRFAVVWQLK